MDRTEIVSNHLLNCKESCVNITVIQTTDKRLAKQLADYYMALAQAYRKMADIEPVPTKNQMRRDARVCNR